jgi:hypothetical protein
MPFLPARVAPVLLALIATLLAACAFPWGIRLEPGKSSEADVVEALGKPAKVFSDADGTRQLAFPRGPEGTQTYMAYLSPDGRLVRLEQVLDDAHIGRIARGTTTGAELERVIGPPWRTVDFSSKRQVAWDYVIQDSWGYTVDLSVMLDERGVVVETVHARRDPGDGGMH